MTKEIYKWRTSYLQNIQKENPNPINVKLIIDSAFNPVVNNLIKTLDKYEIKTNLPSRKQ